MIEIPEAVSLAKQLSDVIVGKEILLRGHTYLYNVATK